MFLINYLVAVAVLHQLCCHIPLCKSSPTNRSVENFAISVNEQQVQTIESCMDLNEDPCDNYYAYACGKWAHQHTGEHYTETLGLIDYRVNKRLIDYFQDYQPRSDFGVKSNKTWTDKIWLYYRACRQSKEMQLKRYLELVRPNANLDWPLLLEVREPNATWSANQFNWLFTLAKLRRYGFHGAFIDHIVTENSENDSVYVISLDKHEAESDNKLPDMATITVLLMHIGVERKRAFLVAKKLWEFESELQKLYEIDDEYGSLKVTLRELQADMPQVPWRLYLQLVLGYEIDLNFKLQISNFSYFVALFEVLNIVSDKLICNYIMIKFLNFLVQDAANSFSKVDCISDVREKMELAIKFLYKKELYCDAPAQYAAEVERIFTHTKHEFAVRLSANQMQLEPTQYNFLKRKLKAIRFQIGNLPANIDDHFVNSYYANVHVSLTDYNKNQLRLLQLRAHKEHAQLVAAPPNVTNYFCAAECDIPGKPPMFDLKMHDALKMGAFGFALSHEIAHAFDTNGLSFDYRGNKQELGESFFYNSNFVTSLMCLQKSTAMYINERVADIVGLRIAYDALFGINSSIKADRLIGNFTVIPTKRLFFLSFAHFFCGNMKGVDDEHDADNVRVQQTLRNFKPFADEYECASGRKMNPEHKCQLY
ncbi:endothelin-converting enzyme 1 isoform X1 [Eurosta solidaginis]|uniref:endothelin-converting enzyme 1 isoform X1 n=1 Tax=Eurosta solidaginis TaxID=178769 RepID=UPI003530A895